MKLAYSEKDVPVHCGLDVDTESARLRYRVMKYKEDNEKYLPDEQIDFEID